jgi:hypothetical protein
MVQEGKGDINLNGGWAYEEVEKNGNVIPGRAV